MTTVLAASLSAHELGTTQAVASFHPDGTYQIDISVDPDALLMKLELASGAAISEIVSAAERDRRIAKLGDVLLDGLDIRFDGRRDRPRFEYRPAAEPGDAVPGVVRASGRVPDDASGWSISYQFVMGWYALEVRTASQPVRTVWLEGGKAAEAGSLKARSSMALRVLPRILPVFVLGLLGACTHFSGTLLRRGTKR